MFTKALPSGRAERIVTPDRLNIRNQSRALPRFCNTDVLLRLDTPATLRLALNHDNHSSFSGQCCCLNCPSKFTASPLDAMRRGTVTLSPLSAPTGQYIRAPDGMDHSGSSSVAHNDCQDERARDGMQCQASLERGVC
jgi:hypothetical protein